MIDDAFGALMKTMDRLVHPSVSATTPAFVAHRYFIATRLALALMGGICLLVFTMVPLTVTSHLHHVGIILLFQAIIALGVSRLGGFRAGVIVSLLTLSLIPSVAGGPAAIAFLMPLIFEGGFVLGWRGALMNAATLIMAVIGALFFGPQSTPLAASLFAVIGVIGTAAALFVSLHFVVTSDRRLTREQDRWRSATALIDGGLIRHDQTGKILGANERLCRMIGIDAASLTERSITERLHLASAPLFLKALSDAEHGAKAVEVQIRLRVEEGADGHLSPDPYRDIMIRLQRVAPHTSQGDSEILALYRPAPSPVKAHKDESADAQTLALQRLAHELRTPLTAIAGFAECLSDPAFKHHDQARVDDYSKLITTSAHHMLDLVGTIAKGDVPQDEAENIDFEILVRETIAMVERDAAAKDTRITAHILPHLPRVTGQRRGLRQVAINLLSNAVKFAPEGTVTVTLRQDGAMLALTVADDGAGVEPDELPHLTEPRFRGHSSRVNQKEGQGFGLAIVRDIVAMHDGLLSIDSQPGQGMAVTVRFPIEKAAADRFQSTRRVIAGGRRYG